MRGKITDFAVLEKKIAEQNRSFTDAPLQVDIYSPNVVDLRLVDLPGLIHVRNELSLFSRGQNPTVKQPTDMRNRIKSVINSYISYPQ